MTLEVTGHDWDMDKVSVRLVGPRSLYDVIQGDHNELGDQINAAFRAVMPTGFILDWVTARMELVAAQPGWRQELRDIARGTEVHNQAASAEAPRVWNNLRFRSESEVRIAMALDAFGVLFFPNCLGRVGPQEQRRRREADFLICHNNKWGILEVDGEPFHPPERKVQEDERDRLFKHHGILVIEHFDANECFNNAPEVVQRFLTIMEKQR
ncbi:MAG TPA: hypothetical protein VII06_30315 [Chloroflexota bacterium]|jgi:hypothetical protein